MSSNERTGYVDVLIVGAGISGIGAACHLQKHSPTCTYAVVEARDAVGGTWDLFRYPGIRSDSDMYTFGFKFKPWIYDKAISPGDMIRNYIREAAREHGIDQHIQFRSRVVSAEWNSKSANWTVTIDHVGTGERRTMTCSFFFSCGGYYSYEQGYAPDFAGSDRFKGPLIHPQHWPKNLDVSGKRIVIIGSGATAVTLAPALADSARHVTMLQRSPTYVVARPGKDGLARFLHAWLPSSVVYWLVRWKNILGGQLLYWFSRTFPERTRRAILDDIKKALGNDYDVERHFTPSYKPWDQRICLIPDGDLFEAIRSGKVDMVTDRIDCFAENGIHLASGRSLEADIVVSATGLNIEVFGKMQLVVDGKRIDPASTCCYKGMMLSDVPNMAFSIGYTNASWTLKSDLVGEYVCRLINYMKRRGYDYCVPRVPPEGIEEAPLMDFTSGYVLRARDQMPKQGTRRPWRLYQNYILDRISLGLGSVTDKSMHFERVD